MYLWPSPSASSRRFAVEGASSPCYFLPFPLHFPLAASTLIHLASMHTQAMKLSGKSKFLIDGFPRNKDNFDGVFFAHTSSIVTQFSLHTR